MSAKNESRRATYLFFREDGFYPLDLPDDDGAIANHVKLNPGTVKVLKFDWGTGKTTMIYPKETADETNAKAGI